GDLAKARDLVKSREVAPAEARRLIDQNEVAVIDVRKATEYDAGHISGAQNSMHLRLPANLENIPRDTPLLVHCQAGVRSAAATSLLEREGFDVINLAGGMNAWTAAGQPVEREPASAPSA
ncbi:MAG: rhodanese-like domain-containing protein, partial [Planctomycetota bacterium]|nr:rhodanese-like domain-containing protein [Planctomycetota bacterium]